MLLCFDPDGPLWRVQVNEFHAAVSMLICPGKGSVKEAVSFPFVARQTES